jgi:predicted 2-oxoglutarate/Fe(II)-dependent dioxygenase YbiX
MNFQIEKLILHKKKFLSKKECDSIIQYYEDNKEKKNKEHCIHAVTGVDTTSTMDVVDIEYGTEIEKLVSGKTEDMINLYHDYTEKFKMFHIYRKNSLLFSHKLRLMKYEKGAWIHPHVDHSIYIYGSCSFNLNNEYEGGDFQFFNGKKKIKLGKGDALIWPADYFWVHQVTPITEGVRYSTNSFLQSVPDSIKNNINNFAELLLKNYKFNPADGRMYNIK